MTRRESLALRSSLCHTGGRDGASAPLAISLNAVMNWTIPATSHIVWFRRRASVNPPHLKRVTCLQLHKWSMLSKIFHALFKTFLTVLLFLYLTIVLNFDLGCAHVRLALKWVLALTIIISKKMAPNISVREDGRDMSFYNPKRYIV